MVKTVKNLVPENKYNLKCPYAMEPKYVVIHNTANDAPAENEIAYMVRNDNQVSFHYAVDDQEIVQGIEENRNAWHCGDGNGDGNRRGIAIEICYSKSGGQKFEAAEKNAAELAASILKKYGWGIDRLKKHQDFNGKYCPHRTLDMGWDRFVKMVEGYLGISSTDDKETEDKEPETAKKSIEEIAKEVIAGKWGNGSERKQKLAAAGYDADAVQEKVNALLGAPAEEAKPAQKSVTEIAKEVIDGKWGNGSDRKEKLKAAGYDPDAVQVKVNELMGEKSESSTPAKKSITEVAKEVVAGKWGNGSARKEKLKAAGYDPDEVQAKVNSLLGASSSSSASNSSSSTKKSVDTIAKEVIAGKWGNGSERKQKLKAAGYDPDEVQKRVNQLM